MKKNPCRSSDLSGQRAVIYARYSTGPNQREESIEGQVRECHEVAERHGLHVIHEYIDKKMSGTNDARPDFQRMLRDADRGLFDVVITWKNDRFARNRYDSAIYKQRLKRNGVKIIYAKETIPDGPEGIILESLLEGMAEYYSANLAQNIRRGQRENALEGKFFGGSVPLGYRLDFDKKFLIDKRKAPIVQEIFKRYVDGEAILDICRDLNSRGFRTAQGKKFNRSSLHRILTNEKYIGVYRYKDIKSNSIPRLISDEIFLAAGRRAERNKRSRRTMHEDSVDYLLTGKLICGYCGSSMGGTCGTSRSGERHYYYHCHCKKIKKTKCIKKSERKEILESLVIDTTINSVLKNPDVVNTIIDHCLELQEKEEKMSPATALRYELKDTEKKIQNILSAIEAGIFTDSTKARLEELEARCADLKCGIASAEIAPPKFSRDQLLFLFEKYQNRDADDPRFIRDIIDTFIHEIYVYNDKILITYNYSDRYTKEDAAVISPRAIEKAATVTVFGFDSSGGDEGNRTPVQKACPISISECSS